MESQFEQECSACVKKMENKEYVGPSLLLTLGMKYFLAFVGPSIYIES